MTLCHLTVTQLRAGLEKGDFSCLEVTRAFLNAMEAHQKLNCYITPTPEKAEAMAQISDARYQKKEARALEGIPLAYKDLFCTAGVRTTAASRILDSFIPTYESTVTEKLENEGIVMLGKLNHDEFAMGSTGSNSYFGQTINPWRKETHPEHDLVPGGSSSGSAASVAAGLCAASLGTDTGGSIRQPAAFCGVVGLKPSYGRCSRRGVIAFASSLDQAGPITRSVEDAAHILKAMAGHDAMDMTSSRLPVPDYPASLMKNAKGIKIGIPKEYNAEGMPDSISNLWKKSALWLQENGAEIIDISLPHTRYALPAYYIIATAEASSNLSRYDGVRYGLREKGDCLEDMYEKTRSAGFGREVKRRILMGTYALSAGYYDAYYLHAQKIRAKIIEDFQSAWTQCDCILAPVTPGSAFPIDEDFDDPIKLYLGDIFTVPASLAGLAGLAIPVGKDDEGLPLGMQILAKPFNESTLFCVGRVLEEAAGFISYLEDKNNKGNENG